MDAPKSNPMEIVQMIVLMLDALPATDLLLLAEKIEFNRVAAENKAAAVNHADESNTDGFELWLALRRKESLMVKLVDGLVNVQVLARLIKDIEQKYPLYPKEQAKDGS